jgi:hypothetical protein
MARLEAFWEEFWKSFTWIGQTFDKWEKIKKAAEMAVVLILLLTGITVTATDIADAIRPGVPWLFGLVAMYIAWKAGIAWHKTSGPIIWIGNLEPDGQGAFVVSVKNTGLSQVDAYVYAFDFRDKFGVMKPTIASELQLPWSGFNDSTSLKLFGERIGYAFVLQTEKDPESNIVCLTALASGIAHGIGYGPTSVPFLPLNQPVKESEITLTIRVDFYETGDDGKFLMSRPKTFVIVPDESTPAIYRITPK